MMKKAVLVHAINKTNNISLREASACVDTIFDVLACAISRGERVELRGFGSFFVKDVKARKSSLTTSDNNVIPAHGKIVFRPCQKLRLAVWNKVK